MTVYEKHRNSVCPVEDIAAYIDGELDAARETEIEVHFAACEQCSLELNLQKQFLCDVTSGLRHEDAIDLPHDFAKKIAVNAESSVSGLRRPRERFNALFICAALALFALFALGTEAGNLLNLAYGLLEQIAAVGSFFGQLVYSFFFGIAIVLRTIAARAGFEVAAAITFASLCVAAALRFRRRVVKLLRV
jgi:hypothetical protein